MPTLNSEAALAVLALLALAAVAAAKPQFTHLPHPSVDEIEAGLRRWADQHPDALQVEIPGRTAEGLPMLVARITDANVPDRDKQVALLTACHAGGELNSCTSLLRLAKWLLSADPEAARARRQQIVVIIPCADPEGYSRRRVGNSLGGSPYMAWTWDGVADPEKNPEAVAIQQVIDQCQPDVHVDVHGVWYEQQTMWESTGLSWASGLCRSYLHAIPRLMNHAAEQAGFLITAGEESAGQVRATAPVEGAEHHFYLGHAGVNDCVYSYHNYHTLAFTMEGGFEESIVIRLRRLLQIGNDQWPGEPHTGYPTGQIGCWTSVAIAAWGSTTEQRRRSRAELWQKLEQLKFGCGHPEPRGTMMAFCATTPAGVGLLADRKIDQVLAKLDPEQYDVEQLSAFYDRTPALNIEGLGGSAKPEESSPIEHGLVMRLLIPYREAKITHLRLDGHEVNESRTDGYLLTRQPGTIIHLNIPPGAIKPLHIATCAYESPEQRRAGFGEEDW